MSLIRKETLVRLPQEARSFLNREENSPFSPSIELFLERQTYFDQIGLTDVFLTSLKTEEEKGRVKLPSMLFKDDLAIGIEKEQKFPKSVITTIVPVRFPTLDGEYHTIRFRINTNADSGQPIIPGQFNALSLSKPLALPPEEDIEKFLFNKLRRHLLDIEEGMLSKGTSSPPWSGPGFFIPTKDEWKPYYYQKIAPLSIRNNDVHAQFLHLNFFSPDSQTITNNITVTTSGTILHTFNPDYAENAPLQSPPIRIRKENTLFFVHHRNLFIDTYGEISGDPYYFGRRHLIRLVDLTKQAIDFIDTFPDKSVHKKS